MLKLHPTEIELKKIYHELSSIGARSVSDEVFADQSTLKAPEELLARAALLSRYDPRLLHVLVDYVYHHWNKLNPYQIRFFMQEFQSAPLVLVIFNFVRSAKSDTELNYMYDYLAKNVDLVSPQLYFMGVHAPASRLMQRATLEPLQEYLDWGFLAREKPIVYFENGERLELGQVSQMARINLARQLADQKNVFSLKDYLEVIGYAVSRQQAVMDLKKCGYFKMMGRGGGVVGKN